MIRTIWKGSLSFGQIAIPVGLAVTHSNGDLAFKTLHRECSTPVKQKRWCPECDRELEAAEITKGYEVAPGQFVVLEADELEAIAPDAGRGIDVREFVDALSIDPLMVERAYYLVPSEHSVGKRPYLLLVEALARTGGAALGRFVAWGAEHVCAVKPLADDSDVLVLQTLRFREDLVAAGEIESALEGTAITEGERELAQKFIEKLWTPIGEADLDSHERPRVRALIDEKLAGKKIVSEARAAAEPAMPAVDLEAALKRSIKDAPPKRARRRRTKTAAARR